MSWSLVGMKGLRTKLFGEWLVHKERGHIQTYFNFSSLTLSLSQVTRTEFLLTISIQYQAVR